MNDNRDNFKKLYESSQASLSDMASRHADSLARIGKIRSQLILILKKNFSKLFSDAEIISGNKISNLEDELILQILESFIRSSNGASVNVNLDPIREILFKLGVKFTGNTLPSLIAFLDELEKQGYRFVDSKDLVSPETTYDENINIVSISSIFDDDNENINNNGDENIGNTFPNNTFKPEIYPQNNIKKRGRKPKIKATRPEAPLFSLLPNPTPVPESQELDERLYKIISSPRPIFMNEIVKIIGDKDLAYQWLESKKNTPSKSPVRFINAKNKHQEYGALLIPAYDLRKGTSYWWTALKNYKGSDLYELGLLFSKLKDVKIKLMHENYLQFSANYNSKNSNFTLYFNGNANIDHDLKNYLIENSSLKIDNFFLATRQEEYLSEVLAKNITEITKNFKIIYSHKIYVMYAWELDNKNNKITPLFQ